MMIDIASGDIRFKIIRDSDKAEDWTFRHVELSYTAPPVEEGDKPYIMNVSADAPDQIRVLMACAEPEGSEIRLRVENVIKRAEELFEEWRAANGGAENGGK